MKIFIAALAVCALAQSALAAGPNCSAIESTSGRLACYDAAFPQKTSKPASAGKDLPRTEYKDPFVAEDARATAKLKNICRGC